MDNAWPVSLTAGRSAFPPSRRHRCAPVAGTESALRSQSRGRLSPGTDALPHSRFIPETLPLRGHHTCAGVGSRADEMSSKSLPSLPPWRIPAITLRIPVSISARFLDHSRSARSFDAPISSLFKDWRHPYRRHRCSRMLFGEDVHDEAKASGLSGGRGARRRGSVPALASSAPGDADSTNSDGGLAEIVVTAQKRNAKSGCRTCRLRFRRFRRTTSNPRHQLDRRARHCRAQREDRTRAHQQDNFMENKN